MQRSPLFFPGTPRPAFRLSKILHAGLDSTGQKHPQDERKMPGAKNYERLLSLSGASFAATQAAGACVSVDRSV